MSQRKAMAQGSESKSATTPFAVEHLKPQNATPDTVELSIVVPALNEEVTVGEFVDWCREGLERAGVVELLRIRLQRLHVVAQRAQRVGLDRLQQQRHTGQGSRRFAKLPASDDDPAEGLETRRVPVDGRSARHDERKGRRVEAGSVYCPVIGGSRAVFISA